MDKVRFYIALFFAKILFILIKIFNKSEGTSFVGLFVLKICPNFLKYASKCVDGSKISVTGTNGKTTTSGILSNIFEQSGKTVIHNEKGANMLSGVANVFAQEFSLFRKFDNCVIESDEAYLTKSFDYINFDFLIVTNLFRDQLDRYGELDTTAKKIKEAIAKSPQTKLVLNADDPIVASFGNEENAIYYGFENVNGILESNSPSESVNCKCGKPLEYDKIFFAHQGHHFCKCGTKRPHCKYSATLEIFEEHSILKVNEIEFKLSIMGLYNAYNALAAISLALECGFLKDEIQNALDNYQPAFGRYQKCNIKGHDAIVQLIKNPTGASEVLKTVDLKSNILIAINDNYADGRDVSWLWDSDFEWLKNIEGKIVVSGIRALDMGLRLKYADISEEKITVIENFKEALNYIVENAEKDSKITILPSYTALLEINKLL